MHAVLEQRAIRRQQAGNVLSRLERAHEKQISVPIGGADRVGPVGNARRTHRDPLSRHVEQPADLVGGEGRWNDHAPGPSRMRRRQAGVVTADLACGALGMLQEVEVVHHHDLRGVTRRQQERVRRERDVARLADQGFDRRPLDIVPGEVEHPHGNAVIGDTCGGDLGPQAGSRPILPRAGEQRDGISGVVTRDRARELMHVPRQRPSASAAPGDSRSRSA